VRRVELRLARQVIENDRRRGKQVLAARRVLKFEPAQGFQGLPDERQRSLLTILGVMQRRAIGLQVHIRPPE